MRFPTDTPYVGPTMCYDEQIDQEQLLRRLAYGMAAPLLGPWGRIDAPFLGRLLDQLANSHAVIVKAGKNRTAAAKIAARLRAELPAERFSLGVLEAPERDQWLVMAYNNVPWDAERPTRFTPNGANWVGMKEVARVLRVGHRQAVNVVKASGVETRRNGGRSEIMVRQSDLVLLANRPRRWQRRKRRAA
jgi:hypothetical protein